MTQIINSVSDLITYAANVNPGNVGVEHARTVGEALRDADDHPAYGEDWSDWLDERADAIAIAATN